MDQSNLGGDFDFDCDFNWDPNEDFDFSLPEIEQEIPPPSTFDNAQTSSFLEQPMPAPFCSSPEQVPQPSPSEAVDQVAPLPQNQKVSSWSLIVQSIAQALPLAETQAERGQLAQILLQSSQFANQNTHVQSPRVEAQPPIGTPTAHRINQFQSMPPPPLPKPAQAGILGRTARAPPPPPIQTTSPSQRRSNPRPTRNLVTSSVDSPDGSAAMTDKTDKTERATNPIQSYRPAGQLPSWGPPEDPTFFEYMSNDYFLKKRRFSTEELWHYIEYNPRFLRLWVQNVASQAASRVGKNISTCMWKGCKAAHNTIAQGFYRVAFDEFPADTNRQDRNASEVRDPLRCAGFVHLYCFEQIFDPSFFHNRFLPASAGGGRQLFDDDRVLVNETKPKCQALNRDRDEILDAYRVWFSQTQPCHAKESPLFVNGPRRPENSLYRALMNSFLATEVQAHVNARDRGYVYMGVYTPEECRRSVDCHKGDLEDLNRRIKLNAAWKDEIKRGGDGSLTVVRARGFGSLSLPQPAHVDPTVDHANDCIVVENGPAHIGEEEMNLFKLVDVDVEARVAEVELDLLECFSAPPQEVPAVEQPTAVEEDLFGEDDLMQMNMGNWPQDVQEEDVSSDDAFEDAHSQQLITEDAPSNKRSRDEDEEEDERPAKRAR